MLEALRSRTQARISGRWQQVHDEVDESHFSVTICPEYCRGYFERTEAFYSRVRALTRDLPTVEITYEHLVGDESGTLAQIWPLLGVDPPPPTHHVLF